MDAPPETHGRRWRHPWLAFLPGLLAVPILLLHGPIPQDPAYHDFADRRTLWGIPHAGDVLTNLPFVVVGLWGLCLRPRLDWRVFFAGVSLTGVGSTLYHLDPTDATLVLDRAPMTLAFMGLFAAVIREGVSEAWGRRLLWPFVVAGLGSVLCWVLTGDLRPYALVQYYPLLTVLLLLLVLPGRFRPLWLALGAYGLSKAAELLDHELHDVLGFASGHNLKHLLAALGAAIVALWLSRRRSVEQPEALA